MGVTLTIDVAAVRHNTAILSRRLSAQGIEIVGVTKAVDGEPVVGRAMLEGGAIALADSRLTSLERLAAHGLGPRHLIRSPQPDEFDAALDVAHSLLLSDIDTARRISARSDGRQARVFMSVDLGDRREGALPDQAVALARKLADLRGVALSGLAVNFACLSGLQPTMRLLEEADALLTEIAGLCEGEPLLSLGGTYCLPHLLSFRPRNRCLARIGGALYFGHYFLPGVAPVPGLLRADPILTATVIESRLKPGPPSGLIGLDAFGHVPERLLPAHETRQVLLAMGRRETEVRCLRPLLSQSRVAAMSSDHTLLVAGGSLRAGDTVDFSLDYEGLVRAVTSPFVRRVFAEGHYCDGSAPWAR